MGKLNFESRYVNLDGKEKRVAWCLESHRYVYTFIELSFLMIYIIYMNIFNLIVILTSQKCMQTKR